MTLPILKATEILSSSMTRYGNQKNQPMELTLTCYAYYVNFSAIEVRDGDFVEELRDHNKLFGIQPD